MLSLIGKTPIIKLKNTINNHNLYAKCEWLNPTGSIKDRVAKYILENLIKNKKIKPQQAIIEASSGNMGTSLAAIEIIQTSCVHYMSWENGTNKKRNDQKFWSKPYNL